MPLSTFFLLQVIDTEGAEIERQVLSSIAGAVTPCHPEYFSLISAEYLWLWCLFPNQ